MSNLKVKILADTKDLVKGVRRTKDELGGIQGVAKKAGGALKGALGGLGIAVGFAAIAQGIIQATKAAAEDVKSQKLLARQLKTTTKATAGQIKGAEKFVETLSNQTGVLDDNLRPALANAVRGTGSLEKAQELVKIALDGAAASGKPLDTVLQALIKASNGNTTSLYKLAPELKKTKGGLDDYAASVKGAAEASADPFAKFNVAIENLTEQFGMLLLPYIEEFINYLTTTVVPAVSKFLEDVANPKTKVGEFWQKAKDAVGKLVKAIARIVESPLGQWILETFSTLTLAALEKAAQLIEAVAAALDTLNMSIELYQILTGEKKAPKLGSSENAKKSEKVLGDIKAFSFGSLDFAKLFEGFLGQERLNFASGGIVLPRRGGTKATIGEAGQAEAVIPLDRLNEFVNGGGGNVININVTRANVSGQDIVQAIQQYERNSGRKIFA